VHNLDNNNNSTAVITPNNMQREKIYKMYTIIDILIIKEVPLQSKITRNCFISKYVTVPTNFISSWSDSRRTTGGRGKDSEREREQTLNTEKSLVNRAGTRRPTVFERKVHYSRVSIGREVSNYQNLEQYGTKTICYVYDFISNSMYTAHNG
jgi:hypothetical protein